MFFCTSEIYIKFGILWRKRWVSDVICFLNYRLQKARLLKCLKRPVSEYFRPVNILKAPKHCLNIHSGIFIIFFDHSERKWAEKYDLSTVWNLETVWEHIETGWNVFSLSKSECLMQPIQMQLSRNRIIFSRFFSEFPKSI